jgi:amidohydrolase
MQEIIKQKSREILDEVIAIRRHIHQNPELSFQEYETSAFVQSKLSEWGIEFENGFVETGIVAIIRAENPKSVVGLRADMDALPILEQNETEYKSQNEGVMHACGHDVHTSILLGTAKVLKDLQSELKYSIKLVFQPGEEKLPGGAKLMIAAGALDNPTVDKMFALHVYPDLDAGEIGMKSGMYMASADEIYITVKGKGGHAAMPDKYISPIVGASKIILELQDRMAAAKPAGVPSVLAFGHIEGHGATNVIPSEVHIKGTFRTMNEEWRAEAHKIIADGIREILDEIGATAELELKVGYPYLENDPELTERSRALLKDQLGAEKVFDITQRMTAEDFAYFSQKVPSTFIRLGVKNEEKGIIYPVHHPKFDIDEISMATGIETLVTLCLPEN